ncbi:MAG TPA: ABC transporter permease subunit [Ramlibacter sp.]|uniref:ABC transporter permease n=1 Tax=Ramlibacter sp. TaxID=1917967 RepID=UPI002CA70EFF|nr:ABC transporter permease subunit [Ramlibacter sp.]HVZ44984.1 ABC transporter permease subunit [Ramlibacter sp.]
MDLQGFGGQLWLGAITTIELALAALLFGALFGAIGCWLQLAKPRALRAIGFGYAAIVRGVPDLLIIFLIYFGGTQTLNAVAGRPVDLNAFAAGTFALALSFGAFASEIFRGAVQAVPRTQSEAAAVLGLTRFQAFLTILAPQALRTGLPPFGNQAIVLLKQTSLVSVIGCDELMRKAAEASGATRQPFTVYLAVALIYLLFTTAATLLLEASERRASRHARA